MRNHQQRHVDDRDRVLSAQQLPRQGRQADLGGVVIVADDVNGPSEIERDDEESKSGRILTVRSASMPRYFLFADHCPVVAADTISRLGRSDDDFNFAFHDGPMLFVTVHRFSGSNIVFGKEAQPESIGKATP